MAKEIEAKFLNINPEVIQRDLIRIGATEVFSERLLRRCVYSLLVKKEGAWARVRDEVDKVTMTYKRVSSLTINGVEEVELVVDSFENAREFLKSIGLIEKGYQETKRARYTTSDNVEFDIDTWPGLTPFLEIEADTEEQVQKYAQKLGFKWQEARFGAVDTVYADTYNITVDWLNNDCPSLTFAKLPWELTSNNKRS